MRNIFAIVFILFISIVNTASARNYYVAATGKNTNAGTSASAPWQTISKVNASWGIIQPGDSILFRRGDIFYGVLVIGKSGVSGKPIKISAYGAGAKPIITGFLRQTSWAGIGSGIYQTYVPGAKSTLNMVVVNNIPQALGRYPNADAANGGYLNYEGSSGSTSVTDNQLLSSPNWTGAEIAVRKNVWLLDRGTITSHSGSRISFSGTTTYTSTNGYGYFIQNDPRTLDKFGEWYYKYSTRYLQMYFGSLAPSNYNIRVSCIDTLVVINNRSYININGVAFDGANGNAINAATGGYINIQNCDFTNCGAMALNVAGVSNLLVENCTTRNMLSNAMVIASSGSSNVTIRGCTFKRTGAIPGMGARNSGNGYKGVRVQVLSNLLVENNRIDSTGYTALEFQGNNVTIRNNVINYFAFVKDDGGGIYTYAAGTDASPGKSYTNRTISNNLVMNGVGAPNGRNSPNLFVSGIYLDGQSMNVNVLNNSVYNVGKNGIHANNPHNIVVKGNTSFGALNTMSVARWVWGSIKNLTIKNNIFYPKLETQRAFLYLNTGINQPQTTSLKTALTSIGNIDSNVYNPVNPQTFHMEIYSTSGGPAVPVSPYSLEAWQINSTHDLHSKRPIKAPLAYTLSSVGANKFSNGTFNASIGGLTIFGSGVTGIFDGSGKISGGSIRLSCSAPTPNRYMTIHSGMGTISSTKKYVLRFSTYGTTVQGIVRAYIRRTASPYDNLVPVQAKSFGVGRKDHEFLFYNPISVSGGSFVIEVEQNSGTTYIDNVTFSEATATVYDINSQVRFEYNDNTRSSRTVSLGSTYYDVYGKSYTSVTIQPCSSMILIKAAPSVTLAKSVVSDSILVDSTLTDSTALLVDSSAYLENPVAVDSSSAKPQRQITQNTSVDSRPLTLNTYPNPSTNVFNVVLQGGSSEKVSLVVYSAEGRLVYQTTGASNNRYSFGNNFMPGIYMLKVLQGNDVHTIRLVKSN